MKILAFETSCDDTSVAILENDRVVAMSTRTQLEHDATGGVVPEVAARSHANAIFPCLEDVLSEAKISIDEIDYIACTREPGLQPSLLTGLTVARTLAESKKIPLLYIHHIESHIFANFLERNHDEIQFPAMVLTISGGHTELYLWKSLFDLELVGQTRDDAVGEAYDKVAKMLGLGFPGGAKIARLADAFRENPDFNQDEKNYWKKFFRPTLKTETAKLIKAIKKSDARIVCGTNTFDVYYDYLSEAGFYADFDKVYASCFMHTRKPDVSFWQYIRNEEKTYDFSDMLFFDDSEANVRAAESLGIHAHRFTEADKAKEFILSVLGNDCKIDFNK